MISKSIEYFGRTMNNWEHQRTKMICFTWNWFQLMAASMAASEQCIHWRCIPSATKTHLRTKWNSIFDSILDSMINRQTSGSLWYDFLFSWTKSWKAHPYPSKTPPRDSIFDSFFNSRTEFGWTHEDLNWNQLSIQIMINYPPYSSQSVELLNNWWVFRTFLSLMSHH